MKYLPDHIKVRNDYRRMDVPDIEAPKGKGLGTPKIETVEGKDQGFSGFGQIAFNLLREAQDEIDEPTFERKSVEAFSSDPQEIATEYGMTMNQLTLLNEGRDLDNLRMGDSITVKAPPVQLAQASGGDTMTDFDTMKASIPDMVESVQSDKNKPTESRKVDMPPARPRGLGVPKKEKDDMPPARPSYEYGGIQSVRNMHSNRFTNWNDETWDNLNDWMIEFESDNKNVESKTKTTASGYYQVTDETGITYANRMENALKRNFIAVPQFVKDLQDGTKRMIDLSRDEQQALYENNLFEQEGSDEAYLNAILKGGAEGETAFMDWYKVGHHTEPTDPLTAERLLDPRFTEKLKRIMEGQSAYINKADAVKKRVNN